MKNERLEMVYGKRTFGFIEENQIGIEFVEIIRSARDKREIAQYSPTKRTSEYIASEIKMNAYKFVERMEILLSNIEE